MGTTEVLFSMNFTALKVLAVAILLRILSTKVVIPDGLMTLRKRIASSDAALSAIAIASFAACCANIPSRTLRLKSGSTFAMESSSNAKRSFSSLFALNIACGVAFPSQS